MNNPSSADERVADYTYLLTWFTFFMMIANVGVWWASAGLRVWIYPYLLRGMEITRPNKVWAMDIAYIPMARGFVYLAVVLDWFSRRFRGSARQQIARTRRSGASLRVFLRYIAGIAD